MHAHTHFDDYFVSTCDIKIQIRMCIGTAKSLNTLLMLKIPTQMFNFKYVFIDFAASNTILKYILVLFIQTLQ